MRNSNGLSSRGVLGKDGYQARAECVDEMVAQSRIGLFGFFYSWVPDILPNICLQVRGQQSRCSSGTAGA